MKSTKSQECRRFLDLPSRPLWSNRALPGTLELTTGPKRAENLSMVDPELLEILVCPVCKQPLVLKNEGQSLKCGECHRVYPIRDEIPVLLVDEAVTEP